MRPFSGFDLGGFPGDADFNAWENELVFFCRDCGKGFSAASRDTEKNYFLYDCGASRSVRAWELASSLLAGGNAAQVSFLLGGMRLPRHLPLSSGALRFPADHQGV